MTGPVVITGAGGFLGAHAVAAARARGLAVRAVLRRALAPPSLPWGDDPGVQTVTADLATPEGAAALVRALDGAGGVIHAAAALAADDAGHARDTLAPTRAVIDALTAVGPGAPTLVLVSSISVYGMAALPAGAALDETVPLEPDPHLRDAYARAKLAQEAMAVRAAQEGGLVIRVLRPGAVYGPGRLWTARLGLRKGPLAVLLGGEVPVPAIHVAQCAEALVLAATVPVATSDIPVPRGPGRLEIVNLVDDAPPTQAEWLAAARPGLGVRRVLALPAWPLERAARALALAGILLPGLAPHLPGLLREPALAARLTPLAYPNARAKARLGWAPSRDFAAGMRAALAAGQ